MKVHINGLLVTTDAKATMELADVNANLLLNIAELTSVNSNLVLNIAELTAANLKLYDSNLKLDLSLDELAAANSLLASLISKKLDQDDFPHVALPYNYIALKNSLNTGLSVGGGIFLDFQSDGGSGNTNWGVTKDFFPVSVSIIFKATDTEIGKLFGEQILVTIRNSSSGALERLFNMVFDSEIAFLPIVLNLLNADFELGALTSWTDYGRRDSGIGNPIVSSDAFYVHAGTYGVSTKYEETNALLNAGYELGDGTDADDWTQSSEVERDNSDPQAGTYAMLFKTTAIVERTLLQTIALDVDNISSFTFYLKGDSGAVMLTITYSDVSTTKHLFAVPASYAQQTVTSMTAGKTIDSLHFEYANNLLNGSFETGDYTGWSDRGSTHGSGLTYITTNSWFVYDGIYGFAMKYYDGGTFWDGWVEQDGLYIAVNDITSFTYRCRKAGIDNNLKTIITYTDDTTTTNNNNTVNLNWFSHTVTGMTAGKTIKKIRFELVSNIDPYNEGSALDNIIIAGTFTTGTMLMDSGVITYTSAYYDAFIEQANLHIPVDDITAFTWYSKMEVSVNYLRLTVTYTDDTTTIHDDTTTTGVFAQYNLTLGGLSAGKIISKLRWELYSSSDPNTDNAALDSIVITVTSSDLLEWNTTIPIVQNKILDTEVLSVKITNKLNYEIDIIEVYVLGLAK